MQNIEKIRTFINNCYYYNRGTDYYGNFNNFPIIDKSVVLQNYDMFCTQPINTPIIKSRTSGSSGQLLEIIWKAEDYYSSIVNAWRFRKKYHITPQDSYVTCHSTTFLDGERATFSIVERKNHISLSKIYCDERHLKRYVKAIVDKEVKWMYFQPSFALVLGEFMQSMNISLPSLALIELTGEKLTLEMRQRISEMFSNSHIVDNYGMQEFNIIAFQNSADSYIVDNQNVFVEIIRKDGTICDDNEIGDIVVTGLHNSLMPLIRYRTGDTGSLNHGILTLQQTSNNDIFYYNGMAISYTVFFDLIEYLVVQGHRIIQFQFVYDKNDLYASFLLTNKLSNDLMIRECIKNYFSKQNIIFDNIYIELSTEVTQLYYSGAKHSYFINNNIHKNKVLIENNC